MTLFHSILLGIVQGLGEFLPISSSAHLAIFPWLLNFPDPGLTFDVGLHLGTLIALLAFFYKDWIQLTKAFFRSIRKKPSQFTTEENLIWYLIIATIPGAIAGKMLEHQAETVFRAPWRIALMMAVMGLVLWLADRYGKKRKTLQQITLLDALIVGGSQALAIVPGTSRSGVTITAGLFRKMDRPTAARFSFLLSTPITAGAVALKFKDILHSHLDLNSIVGIVVSAVVGYFAIKYMLYFLQKYSYSVYVVYRWIFAALVFGVIWLRK